MTLSLVDQHANAPKYQDAVTRTAKDIAEESVCGNMEFLKDFIDECEGGAREPYIGGPISTHRLIADILLAREAQDWELAQAARELRKRYLAAHTEYIREAAERAMR